MAIPFVDLSATGGWSDHGGGMFEKEIGGSRYWAAIDILEPDPLAIGDYPNDWIYIASYDRATSIDHPMEFRMRSEGEVPIAEVLAVLEQKIGGRKPSKRHPTMRGRANPKARRKELYIYPNKTSIAAAKRGLKAREKAPKSKRGGLDAMQAKEAGVGSGVLRARDIIAGKRINAYQVKAFFDRHQGNYISAIAKGLKPEESKAIQAWLIWGGDPLYRQVKRAVERNKREVGGKSRRKNPFRTQGTLPTDAARLDSEWLTQDILDAEYDDDRYREVITSFQEGLAEMDSTGRGGEPQRVPVRPEMIRDAAPLSTRPPDLSWPINVTLTDREWNEFMLRAWMDAAKERGMLTRQGELKKKRFWQKNPIDIVAWEDGVFKMGPEQVLNEIKYVRDVELPQLRSFGTLKEEHGAKMRLTVLKNRAWELGVEDRIPEPWKNPSKRRSYSKQEMLDAFERLHMTTEDSLIEKAHKLWDSYYERPSKLKFQAFLRHQKLMEKQHLSHPSNRLGSELKNIHPVMNAGRARHKIPWPTTTRRRPKAKKRKNPPDEDVLYYEDTASRDPRRHGLKEVFDEETSIVYLVKPLGPAHGAHVATSPFMKDESIVETGAILHFVPLGRGGHKTGRANPPDTPRRRPNGESEKTEKKKSGEEESGA